MKIGDHNSIRISGRSGAVDFLRRMAPGSDIQVRVQERIDSHLAVLNINGRKVRAEFLQGIPGNNRLVMRFEGNNNGVFLFKIISTTSRHDFLDKILEYSVLKPADVLSDNIADIGRVLSNRSEALFSLHALLLDINNWREERDSFKKLYAMLASKGLTKGFLNQLMMMIAQGRGGNLFYFVYGLLLKLKAEKERSIDMGDLNSGIEDLLAAVEDVRDIGGSDMLAMLIDALSDKNRERSSFAYIPLDDDDGSQHAMMLFTGNCIIARVEFSTLGCIDIMAREQGQSINVTIIPELEKTRTVIENSLGELQKILYNSDLNVQVNVFQNSFILDKIVEINSYFMLNSVLDVKV